MIKKIIDGLYNFLYYLSAVGFGILIVILFAQVFTRNVLKFTSGELDEFSKFLFVWLMYIGVSLAVYKEKHISIEFIVEQLGGKTKKNVMVINSVLTIALFVILAVFGFKYALSTMRMMSPILGWVLGIMYICIPVSAVISIVFCALRIYNLLLPRKTEES